MNRLAFLLLVAGCSSEWRFDISPEQDPEDLLTSADGCTLRWNRFEIVFGELGLRDLAGEYSGTPGDGLVELTQEVEPLGPFPAALRLHRNLEMSVAENGVSMEGEIECGGSPVTFAWVFDAPSTYACPNSVIQLSPVNAAVVPVEIDMLEVFSDHLEDGLRSIRMSPVVLADANLDGVVTRDELKSVEVWTLEYQVGRYTDVENLDDWFQQKAESLELYQTAGRCLPW